MDDRDDVGGEGGEGRFDGGRIDCAAPLALDGPHFGAVAPRELRLAPKATLLIELPGA